jgi:hypothetical protein
MRREHVRPDGTVKSDAFIPYKRVELSMTRHVGLGESEIWKIGQAVAEERASTLYGRADAQARVFLRQRLRVVPAPLIDNANHANVVGWPADKQAQKEIALEVVKEAEYKANPTAIG